MKNRTGIILYCETQKRVLLIRRKLNDKERWVVPGGGVQPGESYEDAARRKAMEELNIYIQAMSKFCTINAGGHIEKYFISYLDDCIILKMHREELKSISKNVYEPVWAYTEKPPFTPLYPQHLKDKLIEISQK